MNQNEPNEYRCTTNCLYRHATGGQCVITTRPSRHPQDGQPCLYPEEMRRRSSQIDPVLKARSQLKISPTLPPQISRMIEIASDNIVSDPNKL